MARQETAKTKSDSRLVQIAATIVIIWAMRYAQEVLVPVALAVLFAFLLGPLVHRLERAKVPRVPAVLIVVLLAFSLVFGIAVIVVRQAEELTQNIPQYAGQVEKWISHFKGHNGIFTRASDAMHNLAHEVSATQPSKQSANSGVTNPVTGEPLAAGHISQVEIVSSTPPVLDVLSSTFGPILEVLAISLVVIVLCIFMLLGREDLRDRVIRLVSHGHLNVTNQAMDDAAQRISHYLLLEAMVNGSYGLCVAAGLFIIGVPNPLLWGLLSGLLRFIPYVGVWIAAAVPILLAFVTLSLRHGLFTLGMYIGFEVIVSSFIEPWLYAGGTGVSSIAILIAAVFWAWVWGGVGLLLATPLTVLLVVVGKYVPQLEFLSVLLGDEPVFDPAMRYYQRLLAADQEEAWELIEEYHKKEMSIDQVFQVVMIPALALAHRDNFRGRLDNERAEYIHAAVKEQIEDLAELPAQKPPAAAANNRAVHLTPMTSSQVVAGDNRQPADAAVEYPPLPTVHIDGAEQVNLLCLPARDEADELAGVMFAQVLHQQGFKVEAVSVTSLVGEMLDLVGQKKADIVIISALPPSAIGHARYLCKRLHQKYPHVSLMIGLWTSRGDLSEARNKISCSDRDVVVNNFADGLKQIEQLMQPLLLSKQEAADITETQSPKIDTTSTVQKP